MPTPIELVLHPVSLGVLLLYAILMLWEYLRPARKLPRVRGWHWRGLAAFTLYFFLSSYLPLLWDGTLARYQFLDLSDLGGLSGALVGLFVYEAVLYAWHRGMHEVDVLFQSMHQMHHSAERIDSFGAFYFSPLDMAGFTLMGSLSLSLIVGLSPEAVTLFLFVTMFLGIFQHLNVATPQWLGYIIQRPESHALHHGRDIHYYNFSDLPLFDMLGGTFRNPALFPRQAGYYDGASAKVLDMLLLRDVTKQDEPEVAVSTT